MAEKINLNDEDDFLKNLEEKKDNSKEKKERNENIGGLAEEIWRVVEESDDISKEDFIFLEKNPAVIQKIAASKEYEILLDKYDRGLTSEKSYYNILIDLVKKEISYRKLKTKFEITGLKNKILGKIIDLYDDGKITIKDYEIFENNKDIFDDLVEENYKKLLEIKNEEELEKKVLEIVAQVLEKKAEIEAVTADRKTKERKKSELKSVKIKHRDKEGNIAEREIRFEESTKGWEQFGFSPGARIKEKQTRYKDSEEVRANTVPRLGTILGVDHVGNLKYLKDGGVGGTGVEWTLRAKDKDSALDFIEIVSPQEEAQIKLKTGETRKTREREAQNKIMERAQKYRKEYEDEKAEFDAKIKNNPRIGEERKKELEALLNKMESRLTELESARRK